MDGAQASAGPQPIKCPELVTSIRAHKFANDPDKAWDLLKIKTIKEPGEPVPLDTPIFEDKVRFVCISDTHSRTHLMKYPIPAGDILIHTGETLLCLNSFTLQILDYEKTRLFR